MHRVIKMVNALTCDNARMCGKRAARRSDMPTVPTTLARRRASAEACLRAKRSRRAAAEVAAAHVRGGGRRAEVSWERSEQEAVACRPDGANQEIQPERAARTARTSN